MSKGNGEVMSVKILPNESGSPKGKLADAEVIFEAGSGPFLEDERQVRPKSSTDGRFPSSRTFCQLW